MRTMDDFSRLSGNFIMQASRALWDMPTWDANRNMQAFTLSNTVSLGKTLFEQALLVFTFRDIVLGSFTATSMLVM